MPVRTYRHTSAADLIIITEKQPRRSRTIKNSNMISENLGMNMIKTVDSIALSNKNY